MSGSDAPDQAGFVQSQDSDGRLADRQLTLTPAGGSVANVGQVQPTYDAVGNVASVTTSLGALPGVTTGGSETQAFCYDEQDRLVWASTQTSGPCGRSGSEGLSGAGYTASYSYDPVGRIASQAVTTSGGGGLTYGDNSSGAGATFGAGGQLVGMTLAGGVYTTSYAYDGDTRLSDMQLTRTSDNTRFFESSRAYDAVGNVATVWSRVPQGTDTQAFCYDAQNRLTWAGSAGTKPSGCTSPDTPASTLPGGGYFQGYTYDHLDRLNLGDLGNYAYGSSAHVHAPTSITSGSAAYTASYDPAGNMVCRAPTNATTCAGPSPTGAQLQYDAEERLAHWQNAPSNPTTTASYLYDGAGERVAQQVTSGGTATTTAYVGTLEEVATTGASTTTTTYYSAAGLRVALAVNGVVSYLASDGLGSATVALDANGNPQASVLYRPYGTPRYTSGSMPGSYGFTGQHSDAALTGLDYYGARYYDSAGAVFTTVDSVRAGQNPYGYVSGNPETRTDPSGHTDCEVACEEGGGPDQWGQVVTPEWEPGVGVIADPTTFVEGEPAAIAESADQYVRGLSRANAATEGTSASGTTTVTVPTTPPQPGNPPPGPQVGLPPSQTSTQTQPTNQQTQQAYVADSNIFMRMNPAQQNAVNGYINNPNVTLYITTEQVRELGNAQPPYGRANWTYLWRLMRASGGAKIIIIPAASLASVNVPTTRKLGQADMYLLQTAQAMNLPVLTLDTKMVNQVASYAPATAQWGSKSLYPVVFFAYDSLGNLYNGP